MSSSWPSRIYNSLSFKIARATLKMVFRPSTSMMSHKLTTISIGKYMANIVRNHCDAYIYGENPSSFKRLKTLGMYCFCRLRNT